VGSGDVEKRIAKLMKGEKEDRSRTADIWGRVFCKWGAGRARGAAKVSERGCSRADRESIQLFVPFFRLQKFWERRGGGNKKEKGIKVIARTFAERRLWLKAVGKEGSSGGVLKRLGKKVRDGSTEEGSQTTICSR